MPQVGVPITAVTGISVDITDKKKKEKELLVVKEQLELTLENVAAGIMLLNKTGEIVFANDKAAWFLNVPEAKDLMDDKDISELYKVDPYIVCYVDHNGKTAIDKLKRGEYLLPDIIFIDINMPGMNGWQCLEELKRDLRFRDIPVIMYSTSSYTGDADRAIELGAFFLPSPVIITFCVIS
jgi:CheY-like chemotaxis protein